MAEHDRSSAKQKFTIGTAIAGLLAAGAFGLSNTDAAGQRVDAGQFATAYVDISCPSLND
jgi:hypothetical protein